MLTETYSVFLRSQTAGVEVELDGQDLVEWALQTGGEAVAVPLHVSGRVDRILRGQAVNQVAVAQGLLSGQTLTPNQANDPLHSQGAFTLVFKAPGQPTVEIKDVWLVKRVRALGPNRVLWKMADKRWFVGNIMVDTLFNGMRAVNDVDRAGPPVPQNVAIFTQVPKRAFIPFTCRSNVANKFAKGDSDQGWRPWTALEALRWMVSDDGWLATRDTPPLLPDGTPFSFGRVLESPRVKERKVIVKRWNPKAHWRTAIAELQRESRVGVYIDEQGRFVLEDQEVLNQVMAGYGNYRNAGGIPILNDMTLSAPRKMRLHFPRYDEMRWQYDEEAISRIRNVAGSEAEANALVKAGPGIFQPGDVFWLENVLRMPQDVGGWKAGQWVEIRDAFEAWKNDNINQPIGGLGKEFPTAKDLWTIKAARRFTLTTAFAHLIQKDPTRIQFKNPVLEARVASVYQHFRVTFRIPEIWIDHIEDIKAKVGVIDSTATRLRQPSPVFVDYSTWDSLIYHKSREGDSEKGDGYLRSFPLLDRERQTLNSFIPGISAATSFSQAKDIRLQDLTHGPAKIRWVDRAQGVFDIEFPRDLTGATEAYTHGLFDPNAAQNRLAPRISNTAINAGQRRLLPTYRVVVFLAIRWRSPNSAARYAIAEADGRAFLPYKPLGPETDRFYGGFEAFRKYEDNKVSWGFNPDTNFLTVDHRGALQNETVLKEVAAGEFGREYYPYIPRQIGTFRAQGWSGQGPMGHVRRSRILHEDGKLETELSGEMPPARPTLWEAMSPTTRNVIARFEEQTELDP